MSLPVGNGDAGVAVDVRGSADEDGHGDDAAKADGEHGVEARVSDLLGILEAFGSAGGMQEQVIRHDRGADEPTAVRMPLEASWPAGSCGCG